ncbi:DUF2778 domain-containing protein [Photorhabdus laumondii subsp. laumondii]|uniref:Photorhabdus luminescens subsp. laumondii TTO1 complete genome segment 6/17 n=3 Tax=Photorhabdus TaxID=29487 RepID=Q7N6T0_PHOLL|nr:MULTISPECIES: tlde1 domain-containing protein [Photorhabdus]AWK41328.1 hypothetical protein A4R40_07425 [Photorhabdus laumondii subsp. laumondii]AXG42061.1 DUF2778 domain-containing protein [Photorhabdus laumondii subsp. laumondii]AXG46649.1 DUF2778 domain-containing protein [Photorhabdus laumondii subsp. laumondii]KTL62044.1 hypothetical protein AA106_21405 [Photorhabdus laumondii subsp. laumondii]MCC8373631.1 DUF2778 domain-containing protein [Photorhabdus bodei]
MTWIYQQYSGEIYHDTKLIGHGWSGQGIHKNNPASEGIKNLGPIPRGYYKITGENSSKGPMTIILDPCSYNDMHGRSAFRIHGASRKDPEHSSEGCIILNRDIRREILLSHDMDLVVE